MNAMQRLKSLIRLVFVHALYFSGVLHVLKRRRLRGRAVVLMYHRVLSPVERLASFSSDGIQVSPETFDRHLGFLRRHFNVVSPGEFVERMERGNGFADATCLITFDDGWRDNLTNALPLLRKHGLPAAIFLPTDFIGSDRCFWQETLAHHLHRLHAIYRTQPAAVAHVVVTYRLDEVFAGEGAELKQRIHDFVRALKVRPDAEIQQMIDTVAAAAGNSSEEHPDRFLSWAEVEHMANAGVTFGSHAVTHRVLTRLKKQEVIDEFDTSKRKIAERAGLDARILAYPNGDCNEETTDAARLTGYAAAFTTQPGTVAAGDNRFLIYRINIHDRATRTLAGFYATVLNAI